MIFNQLNIKLFFFLNHFAGKNVFFDQLNIVLAEYSVYIFIFILFFLWFRKQLIYKQITLLSAFATIMGLSLNFLIHLLYSHNRPFVDQVGTTLIKHAPDSSFPSDHTTFMVAIALVLWSFRQTRSLGVGLFILGIYSGLARVYTGIHYPFDILGSVVVAGVVAVGVVYFKKFLQKPSEH